MIKTISVDQLTPGVFVADLHCGWLDHPFARNRFLIKDAGMLAEVRGLGVGRVDIDTAKGVDPTADRPPEPETAPRTAEPTPPPESENEPDPAPEATSAEGTPNSVREERHVAVAIQREAIGTISQIMSQVRLGKPVEPGHAEIVVDKMMESVFRNQDALLSLGLIRDKDYYTFEHSVSVTVLALAMGKAMGFDARTMRALGTGALLHDIGKALTPPEILSKPGRLTDEEFRIMREHVVHSRGLLEATPGISEIALKAAAEHHERYDGTGYPAGLSGNAISIYGRIMALCDVYDAITADRCYREGQEPSGVLKRMLQWAGSHFEEPLVHQFIRCVGIYPVGTLVRMESGRLAVVVEPGTRGLLYPVVRVFFDGAHRRPIHPRDLNLSGEPVDYEDDRIAAYESPADWGVQPQDFMD
ncbi:MAG TPA: HD-GYP domain-containing protein [Gammaproteobacteria bacterium]|nr:HD-GYP domain-containing protein [Gammaproteobacteria bacterium]